MQRLRRGRQGQHRAPRPVRLVFTTAPIVSTVSSQTVLQADAGGPPEASCSPHPHRAPSRPQRLCWGYQKPWRAAERADRARKAMSQQRAHCDSAGEA